jgi:hypothetical protein
MLCRLAALVVLSPFAIVAQNCAGTVRVNVRDTSGLQVVGAEVRLESPGGSSAVAQTDASAYGQNHHATLL